LKPEPGNDEDVERNSTGRNAIKLLGSLITFGRPQG